MKKLYCKGRASQMRFVNARTVSWLQKLAAPKPSPGPIPTAEKQVLLGTRLFCPPNCGNGSMGGPEDGSCLRFWLSLNCFGGPATQKWLPPDTWLHVFFSFAPLSEHYMHKNFGGSCTNRVRATAIHTPCTTINP